MLLKHREAHGKLSKKNIHIFLKQSSLKPFFFFWSVLFAALQFQFL